MKTQKTYMQRKEDIDRKWHLVDAKDQILGRMASDIAQKLIGKKKPTYTPHTDAGDYVVVINARDIKLTRNKAENKKYQWHTGFPGGIREKTFTELNDSNPKRIIEEAVINMLPKNRSRKNRMARLKVYVSSDHNHESQLGGKNGN